MDQCVTERTADRVIGDCSSCQTPMTAYKAADDTVIKRIPPNIFLQSYIQVRKQPPTN